MREYKYQTSDYVYGEKNYRETEQDDEVKYDIFIREDDGEWRESLVEVEEWLKEYVIVAGQKSRSCLELIS